MTGDVPAQRRRRVRREPSSAPWQDFATALLPVLACLLGGATEKWAEGIIVALLGLLLLVNPPRVSLGAIFNLAAVAVIAVAALAFVPAKWFFTPVWREALTNDFGITLPASLSPQPWLTASCLASFVAGIAWLYYAASQELDSRALRRQLRIFAGGVIALAALCIALYCAKTALPFWHNPRNFGPFPNRNQTADLLGITSVVITACAHDDLRHGNKRWIFWALGFAFVLAAILLNFSRAGIAILVVGNALWLGALVLRTGSTARIAIGFSALLVLLTVVLLFGGETLERFHLRGADNAGGVTADFRWLIFRDALQLIRSSPWCGVGLANFSAVFGIFPEASLGQGYAIHPESDWLWLACEAGWPAVILVVVGAVAVARRVFPLSEGTNMRLRLGAFAAGLMFAFHGVVDVSAHRVGSAYAGVFLFALALHRPLALRRSSIVPLVARVVGLLFIAIGALWVIPSARALSWPGGIGADLERRLAIEANKNRNFNEAIAHASRALEWATLDWQLYFVRAAAEVGAGQAAEDALNDFRRARFLEPGSYEIPYAEGLAWIARDPVLTMTAWREALRRAGPERPALYARMISAATQFNPATGRMLQDFASGQPELVLTFLERVNGAAFNATLEQLLARDPALAKLRNEQKTQFFDLWTERGDLSRLDSFVQEHPELLPLAWRGVAKQRAAGHDFRGAVELAQRFAGAPVVPQVTTNESIDLLQQKVLAHPDDYDAGFALYIRQTQADRPDDALIALRRITEQPTAPAYFHFLEANAWSAHGDWDRAWEAWRRFLKL